MATAAPDKKQATLRKLAAKRLPKAIKAIELVGNLASYKPDEAQKDAIMNALVSATKQAGDRLAGKAIASRFTLP